MVLVFSGLLLGTFAAAGAFWHLGLGAAITTACWISPALAALAWSRARQCQGWTLALSGAAAVAWVRCLGLLWGSFPYALCGLVISIGAGVAAGFFLRRRCSGAMPSGLWIAVSGLCGILGLCWLRMIGLNSGEAERLFSPLIHRRLPFLQFLDTQQQSVQPNPVVAS